MININSFSRNIKLNLNRWILNNRFPITTMILLVGLFAFEMFNYTTTDYALKDLLGNLKFAGILWSTLLALAFCLIDFAGIARIFIPGSKSNGIKEDWFLFGAWFLAGTMNTILTWWGVSMSISNHTILSSQIVDGDTIKLVVPIFMAIMVWVTRILLIGSLTYSGQKPLNRNNQRSTRPSINPGVPVSKPQAVSPLSAKGTRLETYNQKSNSHYHNQVKKPDPQYINDGNAFPQSVFQSNSKSQSPSRRF